MFPESSQKDLETEQQQVSFYRRRVMNRGEYDLFRAAMGVTGQQLPGGAFPFYVFPQVSLGQIIGTQDPGKPESEAAYRAINSKRCDLLLADRSGNPVAVLEFQGSRRDTAHHPRATGPPANDHLDAKQLAAQLRERIFIALRRRRAGVGRSSSAEGDPGRVD